MNELTAPPEAEIEGPVPLPAGDLFDAGDNPLTDIQAERQLIGGLLTEPNSIDAVVAEVGEGDFFDVFHRRMFGVFVRARDEGWEVNAKSMGAALGGEWDAVLPGLGLTAGQYVARLMVDADLSLDPAELAAHIQSCSERRAIGLVSDEEFTAGAPFVSRMGLKMWVDQNDPGEEYEYLVEDLIPEREGALMMGETQTGKSFLTYHLGMCVARGVPFFGRRILQARGVIWCAYEAAKGATARMRAYRKHHSLDLEPLPFAVLTKPLALWPAEKAVEELAAEMRGIVRAKFGSTPLGLMVFDTYNAATPGASEIDSETVSKIRENFARLREIMGAASLIVGHTNSLGKHRGNEQLTNNIDTVLLVSRKTTTSGRDTFDVKDDEGRAIRTMKVKKQREGQDGDEFEFVLNVVEDGTVNRYGRPRTSCVVTAPAIADPGNDREPQKREEGQFGVRASPQEKLFVECLLAVLAEQGVPPPAVLGLPQSVRHVVEYDHVKRIMANKMLREDDNTDEGRKTHRDRVKKALKRARERMMYLKVVGCHDPYIWWTGKPVQGVKDTQPKPRDLFENDPPLPGDISDFY